MNVKEDKTKIKIGLLPKGALSGARVLSWSKKEERRE